MSSVAAFAVKCPHCAADVAVEVEAESFVLLPDDQPPRLELVLTPRFEHVCELPPVLV